MKRQLLSSVVVAVFVTAVAASAAAAESLPSGERINGGNGEHGGTVIEPVNDDMTGAISVREHA